MEQLITALGDLDAIGDAVELTRRCRIGTWESNDEKIHKFADRHCLELALVFAKIE